MHFQLHPESVEISPYHLLGAQEGRAPIDLHAEAELFIDWRNEPVKVAPNEGDVLDHLHFIVPEGKFPRDLTAYELRNITGRFAKPTSKI